MLLDGSLKLLDIIILKLDKQRKILNVSELSWPIASETKLKENILLYDVGQIVSM